MLIPLKQWICDSCSEIIKSPEDGWVMYLEADNEAGKSLDLAYGFKIVHNDGSSPLGKGKCFFYGEECLDMHLSAYLGSKGFIWLLSFLDLGPYVMKDYEGPRVKDIREFIEFMRRLTIPYFEEARLYFDQAKSDGNLDPDTLFEEDSLKNLIEMYGRY